VTQAPPLSLSNQFERLVEADEAVRRALAALALKWMEEEAAGREDELLDEALIFRPLVVGGIRSLVELAVDWGLVGETAEAIGDGFKRTAEATVVVYGRAIGWARDEADKALKEKNDESGGDQAGV
jgi:hypothetical protein